MLSTGNLEADDKANIEMLFDGITEHLYGFIDLLLKQKEGQLKHVKKGQNDFNSTYSHVTGISN